MKAAYYIGNKQFDVRAGECQIPDSNQVTLKVSFVGVCGTDMHIYHGVMDARVAPPQIVGHEMSAIVESVGSAVSKVKPGDKVVVRPLDYCGKCPACEAGCSHVCHNLNFMGIDSPGAFQSYWTVHERTLHKLPENVSQQQGALIEPLAVAVHDIKRARLEAGENCVVIGGGPIGQLVAMVAKAKGANVILSEVDETRRQFASEGGILAINPLESNLEEIVADFTAGKGADVVFEVSGVQPAIDIMTKIAAVRGRICIVAIYSQPPTVSLFDFFWKELEMIGARVYESEDFDEAIRLVSIGAVDVERIVSHVDTLDNIGSVFEALEGANRGLKALVDCQE